MKKIDVKGKKIGRICSKISKYINLNQKLIILNFDKVIINKKFYFRHTGFPGGLKKELSFNIVKKKGFSHYIKKVISGMLNGNLKKKLNNIIFKK